MFLQSVSPGAVDTEIMPPSFKNILEFATLKPEDVSNAVVYCISTPPNVQIHELFLRPLHERF